MIGIDAGITPTNLCSFAQRHRALSYVCSRRRGAFTILLGSFSSLCPQLIAQSRAEIETELRDIVLASARAIANNQSPVQHTTPVRVIGNGPHSTQPTPDEKGRERDEKKKARRRGRERKRVEGGKGRKRRERESVTPGFDPGLHCRNAPPCRCPRQFQNI